MFFVLYTKRHFDVLCILKNFLLLLDPSAVMAITFRPVLSIKETPSHTIGYNKSAVIPSVEVCKRKIELEEDAANHYS